LLATTLYGKKRLVEKHHLDVSVIKKPNRNMIYRGLLLSAASAFALVANAQPIDYNDNSYQEDYSQDGLYADYARQQQAKEVAAKA